MVAQNGPDCDAVFGIEAMAKWLGIGRPRLMELIRCGMPCRKQSGGRHGGEWIFSKSNVNGWFMATAKMQYNQTSVPNAVQGPKRD
jgi:hypothetical protein